MFRWINIFRSVEKEETFSKTISIIGIRGLPAKYGGFETFADWFCRSSTFDEITVFCDKSIPKNTNYNYAHRIFLPFSANGIQGVFFDIICILIASVKRDNILLLGCSGALGIPIARLLGIRVVTNIAGLEWSRSKWGRLARFSLRIFEWVAVTFSSKIITDNRKLQDYVNSTYNVMSEFIPYGGNQVLQFQEVEHSLFDFKKYYLAIARSQPDNNLEIIINACDKAGVNLVIISDFSSNHYGKNLKSRYKEIDSIIMLESIYDPNLLGTIRRHAEAYLHGHSAGGTNPVLVESMWQKKACICFNNGFNNSTTNDLGIYFNSAEELEEIITTNISSSENYKRIGNELYEFAKEKYRWDSVIKSYERLYD